MTCKYSCILCGFGVLSTSRSESGEWLREYRAVYRNGTDTSVTGVGHFDGSLLWKLPIDPWLRWNTRSESDHVLEIPVMRQPAASGMHGFILHDACWNLLQKASEPAGLSLERLVSVCESLPFPLWSNGVSWGHDYEGLLELDINGAHPWQERFSNPSIQAVYNMGAMIDPFDESHFHTILALPISHYSRTQLQPAENNDHFSRLPQEVLDMIIVDLPTEDALNLRLVSPSFLPLLDNLPFWLSRFDPDRERAFLFELKEQTTAMDTARTLELYRASRRSVATPGLLNRARVWSLARRLVLLTESSLVKNVADKQTFKFNSKEWVRLAGKEQSPVNLNEWKEFEGGCRPTTTIELKITVSTVKIGIAIVDTGIWDYVTGIRIIDEDGHEQIAGYTLDKNQTLCNVTAFHGFRVAMGPGGVRALQVVGKEQHYSRWVGRIEGVPRSQRLVMEAPVRNLSITFDNYKIMALAVSRPGQTCATNAARLSLRHTALWYPDIPPDDLLLNETSFAGEDPLTGYQPLSWIHFGGPAGKNIAHIRGIRVRSSHSIHSLQIVRDETCGSAYSAKLGCCEDEALSNSPLFPIDGAGGECINSVCVGLRHLQHPEASGFVQRQFLECIRITTNRGRTAFMGKRADDLEIQPVDIAHGTTITGFYGHYDATEGMISLGVISQHILYS